MIDEHNDDHPVDIPTPEEPKVDMNLTLDEILKLKKLVTPELEQLEGCEHPESERDFWAFKKIEEKLESMRKKVSVEGGDN